MIRRLDLITFLVATGISALVILALWLLSFGLVWFVDTLMNNLHTPIATFIIVVVSSMFIAALYMVYISIV